MRVKEKKTRCRNLRNIAFMTRVMLRTSPGYMLGGFLEEIVSQLPGRLIPVLGLKFIIDSVTANDSAQRVMIGIAIMVAVMIAASVYSTLFYELYAKREEERLFYRVTRTVYEHARTLDMKSYDDPAFYADCILAMETSVNSLGQVLYTVKNYLTEFISLLIMASVVVTIDPVCLLIILFFSVIFVPMSKRIADLQVQCDKEVIESKRKLDYFARVFYMRDYVQEIRMNGMQDMLMDKYDKNAVGLIQTIRNFSKKILSRSFILEAGSQSIGFLFVLSAYLGYRTLVTHSVSAGDFVATFNAALSIAGSIMALTVYGVRNFTMSGQMIQKYRRFIETKPQITDGNSIADCFAPETIRFDNVSFTYPGGQKAALDGLSFEIKPYEKIAVVGFNGAGKTTLTNLLLRLYEADSGTVTVGGRDVREETVQSHRERFACVFQDFQVFAATVGENVAMDTVVDADRAWMALCAAGFDKPLPNGLDTFVTKEFDENGLQLSGGEQQKLVIARAFYKKCPYIILDEPSANLDPVAEYDLNVRMMQAAEEKTVIFISHRFSTTRHADRILMMENGRIIESGTHDELMKQNGVYARLFRLQAGKYTAG